MGASTQHFSRDLEYFPGIWAYKQKAGAKGQTSPWGSLNSPFASGNTNAMSDSLARAASFVWVSPLILGFLPAVPWLLDPLSELAAAVFLANRSVVCTRILLITFFFLKASRFSFDLWSSVWKAAVVMLQV